MKKNESLKRNQKNPLQQIMNFMTEQPDYGSKGKEETT